LALASLGQLQRLTSLTLDGNIFFEHDDALALASLGQLRRLEANFYNPATAAAAGLARLEECRVQVFSAHESERVLLPGRVQLYGLEGFDLSRVHTLSLAGSHSVLQQALQAVAALPQLQHLPLQPVCYPRHQSSRQLTGAMAVLAGCRQLKQLTLVGMVGLLEGIVMALMLLPRLRLLRLLGCSPRLSQERCQALVGQLRLYELQVDVVVDDGSARACWMMRKLGESWREA
jgi:hypothetical protein